MCLSAVIHFLPPGYSRREKTHRQRHLRSWTFVGQVIALIWALSVEAPAPPTATARLISDRAFCTQCGSAVGGHFCQSCGSRAGAAVRP